MAILFGCRTVQFLSVMRPMPFTADPGARLKLLRPVFGGFGLERGGEAASNSWQLFELSSDQLLTDLHSSVFRLAWCLLESTRSARFASETE